MAALRQTLLPWAHDDLAQHRRGQSCGWSSAMFCSADYQESQMLVRSSTPETITDIAPARYSPPALVSDAHHHPRLMTEDDEHA